MISEDFVEEVRHVLEKRKIRIALAQDRGSHTHA